MIFGNLQNLGEYPFLDAQIRECFAYAEAHDLMGFEKGSHAIDGERLFVNIVEYTTTTPENRFWEAHRDYLDLHLMLHGAEQIDLNFIQNMEQKEYVPQDDFLPMDGEKNSAVILRDTATAVRWGNRPLSRRPFSKSASDTIAGHGGERDEATPLLRFASYVIIEK